MKKLFRMTISLFMLLFTISSVSAIEDNSRTWISNEYLQLKSNVEAYKTLSQSKTSSKQDEIIYAELSQALQNYPEHIWNLKNSTVDELKNRNYNNDQIDAILNYDGSEEMTIRASAYVSGTFSYSNYYYNSSANKTFATVKVSASWIGTPFFQLKDQLGIAIGAGVGNFIHQSSSSTATYKVSNGKTFTATTEKEILLTTAVIFKFPMQKWSSSLNDAGTLVNISATFTAAVSNRVNLMSYRPCYAHQDVQIGGGVGLSIGASGVSLSFDISRGFTREWYPSARSASL